LDLGFHMNNFDILFTNEVSKDFSKVYHTGVSSCLNREMNITTNISIEKLSVNDITDSIGESFLKETWGIIGGPPCPDFSIGGKNKGSKGERGKLTQTYVDLICTLKPSFFVLENVKGLVSTKKHKVFFDQLIEKLLNHGYAVDYKLINSLNLGVPQDRERIIVIGVQKQIYKSIFKKDYESERNWFYWPNIEMYSNAKEKYTWPKITPYGSNPDCPPGIPKELMAGSYILNQDELSKLKNSSDFFTPKSNKFHIINEGDDSGKSFKRLHRWRYSPAVAYGNNEVHLHPTLPRRLSVRESLRLQTVPDSYYIGEDVSLTVKFKTIGNGVPVKMSYLIAKSLRTFLDFYLYYS